MLQEWLGESSAPHGQPGGAPSGNDFNTDNPDGVGELVPVGSGGAPSDYAEHNRRLHMDSKEFVDSNPAPRLLRMAMTLAPMAKGMRLTLHVSSKEWVEEQQEEAAHGRPRRFRLLEAFHGTTTGPYFAEVRSLLFNDSELGVEAWCGSEASDAFAMLARGAGSVFFLIAKKHRGYPYKLFALLEDASVADEISTDGPDSYDEFTRAFLTFSRHRMLCAAPRPSSPCCWWILWLP